MTGSALLPLFKVQVAVQQSTAISVIAAAPDDFCVLHNVPFLCGNDIGPVLCCDAVTRSQSHAAGFLHNNESTVVDTWNMGDDTADSTSVAAIFSTSAVSKPDAVPTTIQKPEVFRDNDSFADEDSAQVRSQLSADEDEGNINLSIRYKNLGQICQNFCNVIYKKNF